MKTSYSKEFYDEMEDTNLASARVVVPIVINLVNPKSVVDVGCGVGLWLKVFSENGINEVTGIDGEWVDKKRLAIPETSFIRKNLEETTTIDKRADLVMCLEVAEHLDASKASQLVNSLAHIAPVVLFSAAIPLQGGSHHVNEQWPDYWARIFEKKGYIPVDCIRRKIWSDSRVSFFYAQNILIYVDKKKLTEYPKLKKEVEAGYNEALPFVHPQMYLYYAERWRLLVPFFGKFPPRLLHIAKQFLGTFKKKL